MSWWTLSTSNQDHKLSLSVNKGCECLKGEFQFISTCTVSHLCGYCSSMRHANFTLATSVVDIWGNEDWHKTTYIGASSVAPTAFAFIISKACL